MFVYTRLHGGTSHIPAIFLITAASISDLTSDVFLFIALNKLAFFLCQDGWKFEFLGESYWASPLVTLKKFYRLYRCWYWVADRRTNDFQISHSFLLLWGTPSNWNNHVFWRILSAQIWAPLPCWFSNILLFFVEIELYCSGLYPSSPRGSELFALLPGKPPLPVGQKGWLGLRTCLDAVAATGIRPSVLRSYSP